MSSLRRLLGLLLPLALLVGMLQATVLSAASPDGIQPSQATRDLPEGGAIAQVNDIEMYYEVQGEGEPLLLIHGAIGSGEDFAEVIPGYIEAGYQTIAIDCRGRGRSTDSGQPLSYALMASDIVALMDELDIERANIAGQSDGAILGIVMAIEYPDRVNKVVAFGANFNVDGLFPSFTDFVDHVTLADFDEMTGEAYRRLAPDPDYLPVMLEKVRHMLLTQPDFTLEQLMSIEAPVLVFDGENEDTVRIDHAKAMAAAIPNASMVILPGTGHHLMYEDPETYLAYAIPFLTGELDAPPEGKYAAVNDIQMYYEVYGEGDPILLLHSVTGSTAQFADVIPMLAEEYQVIAVDLRGHGRSTDSGQPYTYELMASDIVALMDELGIDKADVVGNKDGGIIGLVMATRYPERLNRLVAASVNYSPAGFQPWFPDWVKSVTVDDFRAMLGERYAEIAPDPGFVPTMLERTRYLLLTQPNFTLDELATITHPVLVLAGADEDVIEVGHIEEMAAAIPNAQLVLIDEGTHGVLDEQTDAWIEAVSDFLHEPMAATGEVAEDTVPRFEPADCVYPDLAAVDAECGYLVVREDRTNPDSPTIRIQVIKVAAMSDEPAPEPIIVIPGGPGADGPFYAWLFGISPISEVMRAEHDLYILETRGAMMSEPGLYCPETEADWAPMVEMTMAEEAAVRREQFIACHDRLVAENVNLSAYGYWDIAQDVADLAAALEFDSVNIYGVSAGTPAAMLTMVVMPEGIRSVVLDSVYPPETTFMPYLAEYLQTALDEAFAACRADAPCAEAYPDLEGALVEVLEQLRAEPVIVTIEQESGESFAVPVDDVKFVRYLHDVIFAGDGFTLIPAAIYTAEAGDFQAVAESWLNYVAGEHSVVSAEGGSWAKGMMYSALCLAEGQHIGVAEAEAAIRSSDVLPSIQDWAVWMLGDYLAPCEAWNVAPASAMALEPVASDLPVLMLTGLYDPEGRASLSRDAADRLPNSFFYELPSGHALVLTECGLDLMTQFWQDPSTAPDAACMEAMTPAWVLPE